MKQCVLVIREFDQFSELLLQQGFEVINLPLIQTLPINNFDELDTKLEQIENYHGLFFTSPKAAQIFIGRSTAKNLKFSGKVYVLGNRTKALFENTEFEIIFSKKANTAEELINSFDKSEFAEKNFLFVRGDKSLRTIPELLKDVAEIDEIIVYQTIENLIEKDLLAEIKNRFWHQTINCVCFFSPSGVENFIKLFGKDLPDKLKIAVIGKTTAEKAVEKNLQVDFVATKAAAENFAIELIECLGRQ